MARIMLSGDSIRNSYEPLVAEILGAEGHEVWGAPGNISSPCLPWPVWAAGSRHFRSRMSCTGTMACTTSGTIRIAPRYRCHSRSTAAICASSAVTCSPPKLASSLPAIHRCTRTAHSATISGPGAMRRSTPTMTPRLVMTELEIPINELHTLVASDVGRLLSSDQLHLSDAGKQTCAEAVCAAIRTHLPT